MATVKLTTELKNRKGEVLKEGEENVVLRDALLTAIDAGLPGDDQMEAKQKVRLFKLGQKVALQDEVEFTAEDTTLVLARALRIYPANVYGQIVEALDPAQLAD